jgi:predicted RNase H-related nuclease YkuK (DUF458 family)
MQYLSDNAYLAIKPESVAGTAVIPTIMLPLVSESIRTVVNHSPDQRMKGINWKANGMLRGFRSHEGEIVVLGDPDTLGHFLNMTFTKGSTTGTADGYTHPFTVGTPDSYTIEIKKGDHVVRYFGVMVDELKLEFQDGQLQITASISAMGQFSVATLGVASSGSVDEIVLDDEYDITPNRGLVTGDVLDIGGTAVTLDASPDADGVTVPVATVSLTASAGATVKLKPQAVSFSTLQDPFYLGNLVAGFGADESEATTNAVQADSTPIYDLAITFKNNLFKQNGSNRIDPVVITPRTREAMVELKQLFENADQRKAWLNREKQAITMKFFGKFIKSDFTTQELFTLKFHNLKLTENGNPLSVGEFIMDEQNFEVLYDNSDAKALTLSLINRTAGSSY